MPTLRHEAAVGAIFALLLAPAFLTAQIDGRVTDEFGNPIPQATVQLRGPDDALQTVVSDTRGRFSFQAFPNAREVWVTALGLAPARAPLGNLLQPLEIVLRPEPLELPPLETAATPFACPEQDDPLARRMWEEATQRVRLPPTESKWGAAVLEWKKGTTRPESFGQVRDTFFAVPGVRWLEVSGGYSSAFLDQERVVLEAEGYGLPLNVSSMDGREEAWDYPYLDGSEAVLFVTPQFIALQTVGLASEGPEGATLSFCDLRKEEPGISGILFLDSEGFPEKAEWRFHTSEPDEGAGGEATFNAEAEYFLPQSGMFWRRTPTGRYYQFSQRYSPWYVGDRDGFRPFMQRIRDTLIGGGDGLK